MNLRDNGAAMDPDARTTGDESDDKEARWTWGPLKLDNKGLAVLFRMEQVLLYLMKQQDFFK